ncbi:unnamed protein product [Auanema sp. JU1783]|nr:unnamed protein product [Auanema sp. JU1783]
MNEQFIETFQKTFGKKPIYHVRCPGRVNIIGEHIDYNDYSVLPMAIKASTFVLVAPSQESRIRIYNVDPTYPSFELSLPSDWNGCNAPKWHDYALCGWKAVLTFLKEEPRGFDLLVTGSIPSSSGLSSSSSLVCSVALATLYIHTKQSFERISRSNFADLCAHAEHLIGTQGGGMDQAAEILSLEGRALKINFNPLSSEPVFLPSDAKFVVLHSGQTMNKAASSEFNQRVAECRLAGKLLLKQNDKEWPKVGIVNLRKVQEMLGCDLSSMISLAEELPEEITREKLDELLGTEAVLSCLTSNTIHLTKFKIRARARHVYSEASRVATFASVCQKNDIAQMGKLMTESHESCRKDYECSCPALDNVVQSCLSAGALGARLTGAGWGGCVVALVNGSSDVSLSHLNVLFTSSPCAGIDGVNMS